MLSFSKSVTMSLLMYVITGLCFHPTNVIKLKCPIPFTKGYQESDYCYHSVNVIKFSLAQIDHIKRLLIYKRNQSDLSEMFCHVKQILYLYAQFLNDSIKISSHIKNGLLQKQITKLKNLKHVISVSLYVCQKLSIWVSISLSVCIAVLLSICLSCCLSISSALSDSPL